MNRETTFQRDVVRVLRLYGWKVIRVQSGSRRVGRTWIQFAPKGTSDLICCTPNGLFAAVEVKVGKGKRTKEQEEFGASIASRGQGISLVVRDLNALECWLHDNVERWRGSVVYEEQSRQRAGAAGHDSATAVETGG